MNAKPAFWENPNYDPIHIRDGGQPFWMREPLPGETFDQISALEDFAKVGYINLSGREGRWNCTLSCDNITVSPLPVNKDKPWIYYESLPKLLQSLGAEYRRLHEAGVV